MFSGVKVVLIAVTLFFCFAVSHAQQAKILTEAVQVIGIVGCERKDKRYADVGERSTALYHR